MSQKFTYLNSANADYIEEVYRRFLENPDSVEDTWRYFFEGIEFGATEMAPPAGDVALEEGNGTLIGAAVSYGNGATTASAPAFTVPVPTGDLMGEVRVAELINAYRELGRVMADINPLVPPPSSHPLLELSRFGLSSGDLSKTYQAAKLLGMGPSKLSEIINVLRETYCGTIGVEYTHIQNRTERDWLQSRMESTRNRSQLDAATKKHILKRLTDSETFERFLHTRYVAQKRFSVEGGESVIPALDCMVEAGAELGASEFVMGMAHRGRLNVLVHVFAKPLEQLLTLFEGTYKVDVSAGEGDVKYHLGYSADFATRQGKRVHLSLASNPSHLEFVNPVIEGIARAKQNTLGDTDRSKVIPIAIHGDAAFAGQGVCYETLNLSLLPGYSTGGTLHIVINNQVGFTTSPDDARSTTYSTDLAKMLEVPIFHVNGDDPEAVWYAARICTEYRQKFKKDAFIDLICYRKHGHNEGDEPSFTQPLLYKKIKAHNSTRQIYAEKLGSAGVVAEGEAQGLVDAFTQKMTEAQTKTKAAPVQPHASTFEGKWKGLKQPNETDIFKPVKTAVAEKTLKEIAEKINRMPAGFQLHSKLGRFFDARLKAVTDGKGIDWGNGETLAYATLLNDGYSIRISGQDAKRGTFTHRHAVLTDFETGQQHTPLSQIGAGRVKFEVYNSHLSETGVMGFEYGYSLADPRTLVLWEAQFGDFANGAQVIIDQFISAGESKWSRMNGLVLLLPHGYEGQGPEHSSARLERFLQLCGRLNMFVCNLTTPAQVFHALRRQMIRDFRKPLVVMTPKSLLRHPQAVSALADFVQGGFEEVLDDPSKPTDARRIVLCSGKVYYDLLASREERGIKDVALVRVEQLYPWPEAKLAQILKGYSAAKEIVWCQEEPRNMGAWGYVFNLWNGGLSDFRKLADGREINYAGREVGASPAVGSPKLHEKEQKALIEKALT